MPILTISESGIKQFRNEPPLARNETRGAYRVACQLCPWEWMGRIDGAPELAVVQARAHEYDMRSKGACGHVSVRSQVIEVYVDEIQGGANHV